jgi:glycosyltransferase involved in cell wall biosynthesis
LLISIITPCLNRAEFITDAIGSVLRQDHPHVEHLVMDGGSTDGTLQVLGGHPHVQVHSQPDDGIYDALNKGLPLTQGEVVGFLNTDDMYEDGVFGAVAAAFARDPDVDAVVGGASIFTADSMVMEFPAVVPGQLLSRSTVGAPIFNAWFFRRRLLEQLGGFDLRYSYVADRDLLIRMAFADVSFAAIDRPAYRYRMHPGSFTLSGRDSGEEEFMFETRALATDYLRRGELTPEDRRLFKHWHSQIVMEQILTAIHANAFHRAAGYLLGGLRHDPGLSVMFAREVRKRTPGLAGRLFGSAKTPS